MFELSEHPFFKRRRNPANGIASQVLLERISPVSFCFMYPDILSLGIRKPAWYFRKKDIVSISEQKVTLSSMGGEK